MKSTNSQKKILPIWPCRLFVFLALAWGQQTLGAGLDAPALFEQEPNNSPQQAIEIKGPVRLYGQLPAGDQDLYLWQVSDTDAVRPWTVHLEGLPTGLTSAQILRLSWSDNGQQVTEAKKLYELSVKNALKPVKSPPLLLEPGPYILGVTRAGGTGASDGGAAEPARNSYRLFLASGNAINPRNTQNHTAEKPFRLRLKDSQAYYASQPDTWISIHIKPEQADKAFRVEGSTVLGGHLTATLSDSRNQPLAQAETEPSGHFFLPPMQLAAGQYLLRLHGTPVPAIRVVKSTIVGTPAAGQEVEPNHTPELANVIEGSGGEFSIQGSFDTDNDHDLYRVMLPPTSEETRWKLTVSAPPSQTLSVCLKNSSGKTLQCKYRLQSAVLPDLALPDRSYVVEVKEGKKNTGYRLTLARQDEAKKQWETEPNDSWQLASFMGPKNLIKGVFTGYDKDTFGFIVPEPGHYWRIQVIGAGVKSLKVLDGSGQTLQTLRGGDNNRQLRLNRLALNAGTHYLQVEGTGQNGKPYRVRLLSTGKIDPNTEVEPNDTETLALPLRWQQTRKGTLNAPADTDYYYFRTGNQEKVRLEITPELPIKGANIRLTGAAYNTALQADQKGRYLLNELLPKGKYTLLIRGNRVPAATDYTVSLSRLPYFGQDETASGGPCQKNNTGHNAPAASTQPGTSTATDNSTGKNPETPRTPDCQVLPDMPVTASLALEHSSVAAFQPYGQQLTGSLNLKNNSAGPLRLALDFALSEQQWKLRNAPESIEIPAGQTSRLPFRVLIPADVPSEQTARLSVRLSSDGHAPAVVHSDIAVSPQAPIRHARWDWGLPKKLLGGFNVAASHLGGRVMPTNNKKRDGQHQQLIDGIAEPGVGFRLRSTEKLPYAVDLALAGGKPVPVAGFVLDTRGKTAPPDTLRQFTVALSQDGQTFTPVLTAEAANTAGPQGFVLPQPVPARFARLVMQSSYSRTNNASRPLSLGEFKVIATPGWDISAGQGINLADPDHGGFVAWSRPVLSPERDRAVLTEENDVRTVLKPKNRELEWVIGFNKTRTALITGLQGVPVAKENNKPQLHRFEVFVSRESPVGPWQAIGSWDMLANPAIRFNKPVWARYVRFLAKNDDSKENQAMWVMPPETLRVFEQPAGKGYLSVVGEWGQGEEKAIYDRVQGIRLPEVKKAGTGVIQTLQPGQLVTGQAQLGQSTALYRIQVPENSNTVLIGLKGDPTVRTVVQVTDEKGQALPLHRENRDQNLHQFSARVKPGQLLRIEVKEPPRSVAFVWDDSGSMANYRHSIYQAITTYARHVRPGMDEANLLVFGGGYLLKNWTGSPRELLTALNEYPRNRNSSHAEEALKQATQGLAEREGTRAIILITDAEFGRGNNSEGLWELFDQVRPRIFTLHVGGNTGIPRQLMRLWPSINNGHLAIINNTDEMDLAFERAKVRLRQPASFTLQVGFDQRKDPGPARLAIKAGENKKNAGAVELILDASGSMLQRLKGKRRIDIAKAVLSQAIDHIPEGTVVALRVFGHRKPNACETLLVSPPSPLNRSRLTGQIKSIQAKNLAKTPIADSLAQVAKDLKGIRGKKAVVLVTDGEETCDGNPGQVLRELHDQGFDLRLNIVGFAIDDENLKEQFEQWASFTGGRYFDAGNSKQLGQSVSEALRVPYVVYNQNGEQVASGTVGGDPVSLPEGVYRIKVDSEPARIFDQVGLIGGKLKQLQL